MHPVRLEDLGFSGRKPKGWLLVDLAWVLHKDYHAIPLSVEKDGKEEPTGHYFGVLRLVRTATESHRLNVILCIDSYPKDRMELFPAYKEDRPKFFNLRQAMKNVVKMATALPGVVAAYSPEMEADDVLYSLSKSIKEPVIIFSGDNDLLQAVGGNVKLARKMKKSDITYVDQTYVHEKFGVGFDKVLMRRVLEGDESDNISGVSNLNKKQIVELCKKNDTIREVAFKVNTQQREEIKRNYELMKLRKCDTHLGKATLDESNEMLEEYAMYSFKRYQNAVTETAGVKRLI